MTAPGKQQAWLEANQRYLVAELGRLKLRLSGDADDAAARIAVDEARAALSAPARIDLLAARFQLSPFERDVLLLCAGVELDAALLRACGEAQGDVRRAHATFALALGALDAPHWSALAPDGPLRRWRMIELDEAAGVTAARLRIDERILHHLAGLDGLDARLAPLLRRTAGAELVADSQLAIGDAIVTALVGPGLVLLGGNDPRGQRDVAAHVAQRLGFELYRLRAEDLPGGVVEQQAFGVLWQREFMLSMRALLIECSPSHGSVVERLVEGLSGPVFVTGLEALSVDRMLVRAHVDKPAPAEQKQLWQRALGAVAEHLDGSLAGVAAQFRLSTHTIITTAHGLRGTLAASSQPDQQLWDACRGLGRAKLHELAQRIAARADWEQLVLPAAQTQMLAQIVVHLRQRLTVHEQWGFSARSARGLGVSALFAGESGTGKTMAAEVVARALHLDLYRIDLSSVVSKYIGETEKNLRRVFDAAEESGAILLFDEADALFGKRSEVKDSHDRYANIEVSYLLQRMEAYSGLAILTTNMKAALDSAFQRRLRFVVSFPFPDQKQRAAIWRNIFPPATPLQGIDLERLAQLQVAGGHIRNIALNAAFLAAEAGEPVRMVHLLQAAQGDAAKRERPIADAETRGWV